MNSRNSMGLMVRGAVALCVCAAAHAVVIDAVMATVDSEAILRSDILTQIAPYVNELKSGAGSQAELAEKIDALMDQALDDAINGKLLAREALLAGLQVTDEDVDKRLEEIRKLYATNEEFLKELQSSGETMPELRDRMKQQVLARSMALRKRNEFEKQIAVSESEVAQYYADNKQKYEHPEQVRVCQIFLPAGSDAQERATVRARIEELKSELDKGTDFAELAKAHSKAPGAEEGGLIGWQRRGDLIEELDAAAFTLPEGGVSDILESAIGFNLLKVEKKEAAGTATLDEARTEIEPELRSKAASVKYEKWIADLRGRSRIQLFK